MLPRLAFLVVCTATTVASADPVAEKLFEDGRAALAAGKLDEACELFRHSDTLEPRAGTIANLGECEERRGHVATAWAAFIDAKARAPAGDPKAAYAAKHITSLAPRLPYLTIVVPPAQRTLGVVVHRNGAVVAPAEYDRKLPLDPGAYRIDVDAVGYVTWHAEVTLVEGKESRVEVPVLVASAEPVPAPHDVAPDRREASPKGGDVPPPVIATTVPVASLPHAYHIGVGLLMGASSDLDFIDGGRLVLNAAPLGPGVLRVVPSVMFTSGIVGVTPPDPVDPYHTYKLHAYSATFEYAYPVTHRLIAAAGIGGGLDHYRQNYADAGVWTNTGWFCVRLSPTFRFDRFDVGAHLQFVLIDSRVVILYEAGVDVFVW